MEMLCSILGKRFTTWRHIFPMAFNLLCISSKEKLLLAQNINSPASLYLHFIISGLKFFNSPTFRWMYGSLGLELSSFHYKPQNEYLLPNS